MYCIKPEAITPTVTDTPAKSTKLLAVKHSQKTNDTKRTVTKVSNTKPNVTTAGPLEDETFHILTEPEHITAVMNDKERDHSSVDLISVISIAGGVMMAVITVAVIIVMVERCRRPRYEDVRKINDIRMQVMIDNNDVPPPYVRSIFHTPLPGKYFICYSRILQVSCWLRQTGERFTVAYGHLRVADLESVYFKYFTRQNYLLIV